MYTLVDLISQSDRAHATNVNDRREIAVRLSDLITWMCDGFGFDGKSIVHIKTDLHLPYSLKYSYVCISKPRM